ncbi:MAG TPA: putative LPS assembly protein LptD [Vicinamibacterales bacterium]|nr:putative LPS assembly protein LptD [Vicinamibacterales bacterium]
MFRLSLTLFLFAFCSLTPLAGRAAAQDITGCKTDFVSSQFSNRLSDNHARFLGTPEQPVRVDCDEMQLFATEIEVFYREGRIVATGDVVFVSGRNRIAAERMEYDTKAKTGSFFNASGTTVLGASAEPRLEGTQEPDAFFWGEELQKIGPKKFRIIGGGFTTCVQPTPRWEVSSGSITLNLDDYALLRNAVFRVKGVPLMYLPVFYYPIQEDDRATGFLMPIYGGATLKGHTISNQFFWALGRSHDATFAHDWFSKAGQGYGAEYRYVLAPGARGEARVYALKEREVTPEQATPTLPVRPASSSYRIDGGLTQPLPGGLRAQAQADYFTSLATQQRYQQDVYRATQRQRTFGANVTGNWAEYVLSARVDQSDYFDTQNTLTRAGALPRITLSRGERAVGRTPIYFGATGEYVTLLRSASRDDVKLRDQGLTRLDFNPTVRVPFTRWPFFTVNSSVSWRGTYWTESLDATGRQIEESIGRRYFDFVARATGPVFNRIFDTPGNGFAQRWKHVIEPSLAVQRTTAIDNFNRIVPLESGTDQIVGNVTRYSYGLANRVYAKREVSREVASVTLSQSYYTDQNAARFDRNFDAGFGSVRNSKFTPVAVLARVSPTDRVQGQFRTEWDHRVRALRTLSAGGSFSNGSWFESAAGWSMRRHIPELPDFSEARATHALNASTTLRTLSNRFGTSYAFHYDFKRDYFTEQRILGYYNAQCCGVAVEWQTWNLQGVAGVAVPQDRRFNVSFTLAGIGTFSNFLGALSGQQQRR